MPTYAIYYKTPKSNQIKWFKNSGMFYTPMSEIIEDCIAHFIKSGVKDRTYLIDSNDSSYTAYLKCHYNPDNRGRGKVRTYTFKDSESNKSYKLDR